VDAAPSPAGWDVVKEALARLREDNERFEQFCAEQLDELEAQREELAQDRQQFDQQRAALQEELDTSRSQLARLASVAVELADARSELVKVKSELLTQREEAADSERRAANLEKQGAQYRREIVALENDLAESRDRADSEKRRLADHRAEWVGELLRSALDMQGSERPEADLKVVHDDADVSNDAEAIARVDPVLGAVMQQFENLQKGRPKSGRQGVA
jgi:chromosome segregation ATPase